MVSKFRIGISFLHIEVIVQDRLQALPFDILIHFLKTAAVIDFKLLIPPIINNDQINPLDVHEKQLCQILCAYRIFLPFVGITVSSRESAQFRNGIVKIRYCLRQRGYVGCRLQFFVG